MTINAAPKAVTLVPLGSGALSSAQPSGPAQVELLLFEDFEGDTNSLVDVSLVTITSSEPYAGNRCALVNTKNGVSDELCTNPSSINSISSVAVNASSLISIETKDTYTYKFYIKVDDVLWINSSGVPPSDPLYMDCKFGYYGPQGYKVQRGFYVGGANLPSGLAFGDNSGGYYNVGGQNWWTYYPWAQGRAVFYLTGVGTSFGSDGVWHEIALVVDYSHPEYQQATLYLDGVIQTNAIYAPDGVMRLPKGYIVQDFSTFYTGPSDNNNSTPRTGTPCRVRFDQIEIWRGEAVSSLI